MSPVPIENYVIQSPDNNSQTEIIGMDPANDSEKTCRNIAAEIAALLEETPDYDEDVADVDLKDDNIHAPLAPVRPKRRSKHGSDDDEERIRRSSCFLTEIEDLDEESEVTETETVQTKPSIVDFYLKKQESVEEILGCSQ